MEDCLFGQSSFFSLHFGIMGFYVFYIAKKYILRLIKIFVLCRLNLTCFGIGFLFV